MIEVVFFSVAGQLDIPEITEKFSAWVNDEKVPKPYKEALRYTLEIVKEGGHYPAKDYYDLYFSDSGHYYASVTELLHFSKQIDDFYARQDVQSKVISAINTSSTLEELRSSISSIVESVETIDVVSDLYKPKLYIEQVETTVMDGLKTGITPIDQLTNGFLPTSVATIAAYTGEGKTTACLSTLYSAAKKGKKGVYLSLEMAPEIIWLELETRYLYESCQLQVSTTDLLQRKLSKEVTEKVKAAEPKFTEEIAKHLLIVDSSELGNQPFSSSDFWISLYKKWDRFLGGLDVVCYDHVGQFEKLYPDKGNRILKLITDATYRFRDSRSQAHVALWLCQANRDGWRRAAKHGGVYDKAAVADLNEVERSSSYLVFLYTPEDKVIVQETLVTMAKHRYGAILSEPTPVAFIPSVITVGSDVEQISYGDDFSDFGADFGLGDLGTVDFE